MISGWSNPEAPEGPAGQQDSRTQNSGLRHYINARVTVYYLSGVLDTGALLYLDSDWIEVVKDNGERLLIPTTAIRLIKLLEERLPQSQAATLLRSADQPDGTLSGE